MDVGVSTELETVRGVLIEGGAEGIVLGLPGSDYRLHLKVTDPLAQAPGASIRGTIRAQAMRVDHTAAGGRFIEPLYGRPRRLQGRIVSTDTDAQRVTVRCACPVQCRVGRGQSVSDFKVGDFVTFDVENDALFIPAP